MARKDLDPVGELEQPLQRAKEILRTLLCPDREIGASGIAHEERVPCEHEPRRASPRAIGDREAHVLRPVTRRVEHAHKHLPDLDLGSVLERLVRVLRLGSRMNRDRHSVLEREAPVSRQVIRVRVRDERANQPHLVPLRGSKQVAEREERVDNHRDTCVLVADQVRRAAEIVVQELPEKHGFDASTRLGFPS